MEHCIYCKKETPRRGKYTLAMPALRQKGQLGDNSVYACCDECREKAEAYLAMYDRFKIVFAVLSALSLIGLLVFGSFLPDAMLAGVCLLVLGFAVIVLPFGTPKTILLYGIKRMKIFARIAGLILAGLGISMLI